MLVFLAERALHIGNFLEVGLAKFGLRPGTSKVLGGFRSAAFEILSLDTGLGVRDGAEEVGGGLPRLRLVAESVEVVESLVSGAEVDLSSLIDEADLEKERAQI